MARNEEKHFCNLNKLILLKEKEEYEKAHPQRPRLGALCTPEEIQKWLPSIKSDIDFYLKKSQVTCYSDAHVEECKEKVVKLEKEFKAFVRKIKKLSPSPLDAIPWTSRPYKRKKPSNSDEIISKDFKHIATPILDYEKTAAISSSNSKSPQCIEIDWNVMDQPLNFSTNNEKTEIDREINMNVCNSYTGNCHPEKCNTDYSAKTNTIPTKRHVCIEENHSQKVPIAGQIHSIVNYDSSDNESS